MEAIFFAVDIVGMILVLYWSIVNDDRKPGTPTFGLFAYHETIGRIKAAAGRRGPPGPPVGPPLAPPAGPPPAPPRRNR